MSLPLPGGWTTGKAFTAAAENNVEAAVNALGAGTLPIPKRIDTSGAASLTLTTAYNVYVFTGSSAATWTMPAVGGNTGAVLELYNAGTAVVTPTCAGSDEFYYAGNLLPSLQLIPGASMTVIDSGSHWIVENPTALSVTHDNSALSAHQSALANNTAFTWSHTAGGAAYAIVGVYATGSYDIQAQITVTFGAVTLTCISDGPLYCNDTLASAPAWFFGGFVPAGTQTVSVTLNESGKTFTGWAASFTYLNVSLLLPFNYQSGSSATISAVLPTPANSRVFTSIHEVSAEAFSSTFNMTTRQMSQLNGVGTPYMLAGEVAGAPDLLVGTSPAASNNWALFAQPMLANSVFTATVSHDATASGIDNHATASSFSWSHTATAGAYVIVAAAVYNYNFFSTPNTVTYGGTSMTLLGTAQMDNNSSYVVAFFGLASVTGGAQTIVHTFGAGSGTYYAIGCSSSYLNVSSVSVLNPSFGSTSSVYQPTSCQTDQMTVQTFAAADASARAAFSSLSGGTNRFNGAVTGTQLGLVLSDASAPANFAAAVGPAFWAGTPLLLSPAIS